MLNKIINEIKQNPHGKVARNAAHWLAVHVMTWPLEHYSIFLEDEIYYLDDEGERIMQDIYWRPFTDPNHTRMLVKAGGKLSLYPVPMSYCERKRLSQGVTNASHDYPVQTGHVYALHYAGLAMNPYGDDTTHDTCQVLRDCHVEGALTNDELERWRA